MSQQARNNPEECAAQSWRETVNGAPKPEQADVDLLGLAQGIHERMQQPGYPHADESIVEALRELVTAAEAFHTNVPLEYCWGEDSTQLADALTRARAVLGEGEER